MKRVLVAFALVLSALSAVAATKTMFGNYDCGQWFAKNVPARTWLLGYLSGLAAMDLQHEVDVLDRLNSADQAFLWMDNYCKANPLKSVSNGGNALYTELRERK